MATFVLLLLVLLSQSLPAISSSRIGRSDPNHGGFSLDLVHRDSPLSPLYDPSSTLAQRTEQAAQRSLSRSRHFASGLSSANGAHSPVKPGVGDYLVTLSLGTPLRSYWAILDTGSDLIWTQCRPCDSCTGRTLSMFDPLHSSTYKNQGCTTSFCTGLPKEERRCDHDSVCGFRHVYGDQSFVDGTLASETFWFDAGVSFPAIAFGCVHDEGGVLAENQVAGIVALGGGPLSLISQISNSVDNKFAHCLVPLSAKTATGRLKFGKDAAFPGGTGKVQQTPMAKGGDQGSYYVLTLNDVSVGSNRLNLISGSHAQSEQQSGRTGVGPMVIDSGSTLTLLRKDVYGGVQTAVANAITGYARVASPPEGFDLCYRAGPSDLVHFPELTFHFAGADWMLPASNAWVRGGEGIACLAIVHTDDDVNVFGNVAQQNVYVQYDLGKGVLSFAPTDCTKA